MYFEITPVNSEKNSDFDATRSPNVASGVRRARERHRVGWLAATRFPQRCERQRLLTAKRPVPGTTRDWRGERHGRSKNFSYRTEARIEQCHAAAFNRARTAVRTDKKKYPRSLRDAPSVAYGRGSRVRARAQRIYQKFQKHDTRQQV